VKRKLVKNQKRRKKKKIGQFRCGMESSAFEISFFISPHHLPQMVFFGAHKSSSKLGGIENEI